MMNYDLLKVAPERVEAQALTASGKTRVGFAHVHVAYPPAGVEHHYYDLRGLGRHQQKFRNWCKVKYAQQEYVIYFGGAT